MRASLILGFFVICAGFSAMGQDLNTQRIRDLISSPADFSERFQIADSIYKANQYSNLAVAGYVAKEMERLVKSSDKELEKVRALQVRTDLYFSEGNFFAAKKYAQGILDAGVVLHEPSITTDGYLRLSESYLRLQRLDFAGFFAARAYDLAMENQAYGLVADALRMMGLVSQELGQDSAAYAAFTRSVVVVRGSGYPVNVENIRELARFHLNVNQVDSALYYLGIIINRSKHTSNLLMQADGYLDMVKIQTDLRKKIQYLDSAQVITRESYYNVGEIKILIEQANLNLSRRDYFSASGNLKKALSLAEQNHADVFVLEILSRLGTIAEQQGDASTALKFFKRYGNLRDSLIKNDVLANTTKYQMEFPGQAKDREIAALNEVNELRKYELRQEQFIRNILIIAFLVTAGLLYLVFRISRRRVHINRLLVENQKELQRRSAELTELNKLKDKFFSIISHDLKAPINSLAGVLNLMEKNGVKPDELPELTRELKVQFNNTRNLITNLLNWALLQMDRVTVRKEQIDLKSLVDENFRLVETLSSKKLELSNLIIPGVTVSADLNMINLVIRNLVINAVKFTEAGGFVKVSAEQRGNEMVICVADNGVGIAPEIQELLLKSNSGYTSRGTENEKGTGLGLSLCKEFVERNQGKIWLTSSPGHGTKFYFTVPLS